MKFHPRLLALAVVLPALLARTLPGTRTIDDAYITFRYARNLLAGEGFVYNAGERVLGTTTPLYGGLMALLGAFTGGADAPFPALALAANAVFDAAACLLLLRLGRRLGAPAAGTAAACVWAVLPFSVTFAIGGMETSLFVLLLTATAAAHLEGRHAPAALLAALTLLTRPDGLLLVAPLALDRLWQLRNSPQNYARQGLGCETAGRLDTPYAIRSIAREAALFLLPLLAWGAFAAVYYGSPIPHSIAAKTAAYLIPPDAAFTRLTQHYAVPFMDNLTFGIPGIAAGVLVYPFLFAVGARRLIKQAPRAWGWLAFPWLWYFAYVFANPLIFRWYLTPPLTPYIFGILAGIEFILRDARASRGSASRWEGLIPAALVVIPAGLVLRGWALAPDHGLSRPAPEMAWYALELKYREAAAFLLPEIAAAGEPVTLAAGDIGALGYDTPARILDTLGLISPQAAPYYPADPAYYVIAYAVPPDLIADLQPDYIVLLEVYGREGLFQDARFQAAYTLIHVVETDIYGSAGMLIFARR